MELVGGTCRCTVVTSPTTLTSLMRMAGCATASTTRCGSLASFEKRLLGVGWCLPVTDSNTVSASFRGRKSIWNSALGNYWVRVSSSERIACHSSPVSLDRGSRERRSSFSVGREFGALRSRRLLQRDEMDCAMRHLMDPAPFRGVSQAPSRVRDAEDSMVPMAFFRFGKSKLPDVVQAGDPVLHEPAEEVKREDIGSARIEKAINDMVDVMRAGPGVGLAAPQIGIPLQIIVLEDTKELMNYTSPEECEAQQRTPFDLLVIINPKLEMKASGGTAFFFEGCLSVAGHRALVERHLEVEVTGLGRDGQPLHFTAKGWKARILQHEYDHLQGLLYVDQMVKRTFRTTDNLRLPLPSGCPRPGVSRTPACT